MVLIFDYTFANATFDGPTKGTVPNSTFTLGFAPAIWTNTTLRDIVVTVNVDNVQRDNTITATEFFTVRHGNKVLGNLAFTTAADQPIDPLNPQIFTLPKYESVVYLASGVFSSYLNANVVVNVDGNGRRVYITKKKNCGCGYGY